MAGVELVRYAQNPIGFQREFRSWTGDVGRSLARVGLETKKDASATAPQETGALRAGHALDLGHHGVDRDLEARIIAVPPHAIFVIKGTKPHVIKAKRAPKLVFFWRKVGRVVSFASVNHPGTKANNYLDRALDREVRRNY